jgi:hypothetical protein
MFNLFKKKYTNKRELEIDLFFKYVNWYKLLVQQWELYPNFTVANDKVGQLRKNTETIRRIWKANPEQDLAQILSLMCFLPKRLPKTDWYFDDIPTILQKMGIREADYYIWGSAYNIFGRKRRQMIYRVVSEMSTWHIKRIMKSKYLRISNHSAHVFQWELTKRGVKLW